MHGCATSVKQLNIKANSSSVGSRVTIHPVLWPTDRAQQQSTEGSLAACRETWAPTGVLRPVKSPIWQNPKTLKAFDWVICKLTWQIKLDVGCDQRRPTNTRLDESLVPHLDPNSCWWAGGSKICSPDNIHSQA